MRSEGSWDDGVDEPHEYDESAAVVFDFAESSTPVFGADPETGWCTAEDDLSAGLARERPDVIFTVGNPSGTLSASAGLGGRIQRIDVNDVSGLDEARLSEEITALATLAREKARAAQHEVTVELMGRLGQDRSGVSAFLMHSLDLPTYESASSLLAETLSARYRTNDD